MNSDMNSPAGQQSTGTATHPPTAAVTAARAAANEAAGKAGLEAVQTVLSSFCLALRAQSGVARFFSVVAVEVGLQAEPDA